MNNDPWATFLTWEQASRDTIDFKTIYVDMADDLITGLLLSQIVYWYLPSKKGQSKLRVFKDGYYWIAKARHEWWDEIRVKTRQIDRAIEILEEKGIIVSHLYRFNNAPTTHIRIVKDGFLAAWDAALARFDETVKSETPSDPFSPNRQFDFTDPSSGFDEMVISDLPESVQSITETTIDSTEITAETTSDFPEDSRVLTSKQMIQATADLFDEVGPEEIDAELHEAGYDPDEVGARMKAVADQAIVDQIIEQAETHPDQFDLARITEEKRAEAGGNYATPAHAGGDDHAASLACDLFCEMQKQMPTADERKAMIKDLAETLKPTAASIEEIEDAFEIMNKDFVYRIGNYNVFQNSFKQDLRTCIARVRGKAIEDTAPRHQPESAILSQEALQERQAARPPPPQDDAVGQGIKSQLEAQMGRNEFRQYVNPCGFTCLDGALVVAAPDAFTRDWLENRLGVTIERTLAGVADGPQGVVFETKEVIS